MNTAGPTPARVLVVDDERVIADTLGVILQAAGFHVTVRYDGESAIAAAQIFRPDIVVADYSMPPGMNGIDACVEIQRMLPGCRIVMLSGQPLTEAFAPQQTKGFKFLLLSKPMHPNELLQAISSENMRASDSVEHARVLHVDDVEAHRYSVSRLLARAGFEVHEAATGADAVREAMESKPDLILLDIHLPDRDGYDICAALKHNPDTARITVIHITASDRSPESALRSAEAGADEFITYPIEPTELVKRVREMLQLRYLKEEAG